MHHGRPYKIHWYGAREEDQALLEPLVPFRGTPPGGEISKRSRSRLGYRVPLEDGRAIYIKRYKVTGLRRRSAALAGPSKARREYNVSVWAEKRGLPVARVLGGADVYSHGRLRESYIAHEAFEPALTLEDITRAWNREASSGDRDQLRRDVAAMLVGVQQKGLEHVDLRAEHILVRQTEEGPAELCLIDLDNARRHRSPLGFSAIVRNLVQINRSMWYPQVSPFERLKFLREYIKVHPRLSNANTRDLWKRIAALSAIRKRKGPRSMRFLVRGIRLWDRTRFELTGTISSGLRKRLKT
jgi:hypothetical protein